MQFKNFFQFMSVATLACTVCLTTQAQGASAKTKKHLIAHHYNQYFVPPPPAYVPSMGPSTGYSSSVEADAEQTATDNPYSKYIYVRQGYQAPTRVQQNKYVTTWNRG
ncbi:MAG: hypothetical protein P4L53_13010 [Candidatus Obscuribacterales bacterium]|nr:hypothetical protein [Candidatus Obscuribacterales bacterium]